MNVPGPPARIAASAATLGGKVVLFGGQDDNENPLGDTWVWDGASWTQLEVAGPSPRWFPAMAGP